MRGVYLVLLLVLPVSLCVASVSPSGLYNASVVLRPVSACSLRIHETLTFTPTTLDSIPVDIPISDSFAPHNLSLSRNGTPLSVTLHFPSSSIARVHLPTLPHSTALSFDLSYTLPLSISNFSTSACHPLHPSPLLTPPSNIFPYHTTIPTHTLQFLHLHAIPRHPSHTLTTLPPFASPISAPTRIGIATSLEKPPDGLVVYIREQGARVCDRQLRCVGRDVRQVNETKKESAVTEWYVWVSLVVAAFIAIGVVACIGQKFCGGANDQDHAQQTQQTGDSQQQTYMHQMGPKPGTAAAYWNSAMMQSVGIHAYAAGGYGSGPPRVKTAKEMQAAAAAAAAQPSAAQGSAAG